MPLTRRLLIAAAAASLSGAACSASDRPETLIDELAAALDEQATLLNSVDTAEDVDRIAGRLRKSLARSRRISARLEAMRPEIERQDGLAARLRERLRGAARRNQAALDALDRRLGREAKLSLLSVMQQASQ